MTCTVHRWFLPLLVISTVAAQSEELARWEHYGGGQHGMQYSSLEKITRDNVAELEETWRFRTGELGEGHREPFAFQANPILVEGRLYVSTGSAIVFALDPATGEQIWRYDPQIDRSKGHSEIANRGVTSWVDPEAARGSDAAGAGPQGSHRDERCAPHDQHDDSLTLPGAPV